MCTNEEKSAEKIIVIKDFLQATSEASKRTRSVTLTMVVACVLVFGGFINSCQNQWMLARIHAIADPQSDYVASKIGPYLSSQVPTPLGTPEQNYLKRYEALYSAMMHSYVENSLSIRVPLFGFSLDANDIGILGGLAFIIVLIMHRFCIAREIENLQMCYAKAREIDQLRDFYDLLAMNQVYTIPRSNPDGHNSQAGSRNLDTGTWRRSLLNTLFKAVWALPVSVHLFVTIHDWITKSLGDSIDPVHSVTIMLSEVLILVILVMLTTMSIRRLFKLDQIWDQWWNEIIGKNYSPAPLTSDYAASPV